MLERPVTSVADLKSRVELLRPKITLPETEDSWEIISKALQSLSDLCLNGACDFPTELISTVRSISRPLTSSMVSERTRLSGVAIDLTSAVAAGLGTLFEPLLSIFMPVLLSLCGRTNKVLITRARLCITNIVETTQLPSILPYFIQSIKDKSTSIRLTAAEGTLSCMNCLNPPDLEKDTRARDIETVIRTTARDAQADIRAVSRKVFEAYKLLLPSRVESFIAPLSPKMKKYLDIKLANVRTEPPISRLTSSLDVRNHLSSSTSAMPSTRGRPESGPSVTHARSASSSALSTERHMATTNPKAPGPAKTMNQQKSTKATDMPPPLYIPVRPTQTSKVVSVSRSTSGVEARPRVVSTTPVLRPGATTAHSKPPVGLAARTNPADSHREGPHRPQVLTTNSAASQQESSSGPRRVPIPDVSLKASETEKRQQVETTRARVNSAAPRLLHSSGKATNSGANALPVVPVREKPKPVPKVVLEDAAQTGASSRSAKSGDVAGKAIKSGGVTQPTLSQLSRVKATAERNPSSVAAAKQLWGRPTSKPNLSSASSQSSFPRSKSKPGPASRNGGKEPTQPNDIPLPPSPTPPTTSTPVGDDDEPSPPSEASTCSSPCSCHSTNRRFRSRCCNRGSRFAYVRN
ncbi:clasp N terminal-domain-containing protein [Lyophyllum atratum]|nr:clasp N terminal-domain-containing protein [Lyophyllum atratum]